MLYLKFLDLLEKSDREKLTQQLARYQCDTGNLILNESWPDKTDIAMAILALANSGGGAMVIGLKEKDKKGKKETLALNGVKELLDESTLRNSLQKTLTDDAIWKIINVHGSGQEKDKKRTKPLQVLCVQNTQQHLPLLASHTSGKPICNCVYVLKNNKPAKATNEQLQAMLAAYISERTNTDSASGLKAHLRQLKTLLQERAEIELERTSKNKAGIDHSQYRSYLDACIKFKKHIIKLALEN